MKQRSPVSFISLSAFLHGAAFLGLAILPALNLVPFDQLKDSIEITEAVGDKGTEAPVPTAAATPPVPTVEEAKPVETKPVASIPKPVVPPRPLFVKKAARPAQKKIVEIDATPAEEPTDESITEAGIATEKFEETQEEQFIPAPETTGPINADEQIVQSTIESATSEALSKQAREDLNAMPAPTVNPVAENLSDIGSQKPVATTGSNELDSVAGPSADDLRSYLDLKQARGNRAPLYPTVARKSGWEGEVVLNYYVTNDGNVTNVRIVRSSGHAALDQEAVRAISRYRFVKGQEGWASHPVVFSLKTTAQNLEIKE